MNRQEKEKLVLELSKQGKTIRDIAHIAHMSFGDICFIIRRETGEAEEQERSRMSKASHALKLFEQGNNPVQVAIKLDIQTQEVERLYKEYWKLDGLYKLNEIYAELKDNIISFVELYQLAKQEGMTPQRVINSLKMAEEIPDLEARYEHIKDNIHMDKPRISELIKQKMSLRNELKSMLDELQSFREYRDDELKLMQEEIASARKQTDNELSKQKQSLANEVDKYKASLASELKFLQAGIDKLKKEEQQLTSRIQRLNNEELEILRLMEGQRRSKQHEQSIQESQSQPQLVYQQPVQQEMPTLSDEELRILAIPLICNNWESNWGELMRHGLYDINHIRTP